MKRRCEVPHDEAALKVPACEFKPRLSRTFQNERKNRHRNVYMRRRISAVRMARTIAVVVSPARTLNRLPSAKLTKSMEQSTNACGQVVVMWERCCRRGGGKPYRQEQEDLPS